MLNKVIEFAIANRLLAVLALIAMVAGAYIMLPRLNLDAFPDVTNVQVQVNTEAQGLAATEVEQLITFPIEAVMYALPDVEEVRSISKTGLSVITVVFKENTDIYLARQLVFQRLQTAREEIPQAVGTPVIGPNTSGLGQVYQYILRSDNSAQYDTLALRSLNDWVVKLLLMPVAGVTDVLSFGGNVRQYQVRIQPQKLLAFGLNIDQVAAAIEENNRNAGGWYLDRGSEQLVIRGVGWVRSGEVGLRDIRNVPLLSKDGVAVRVADVATVSFGSEIRQGAVSMTRRSSDGEAIALGEVVAGIVLSRTGANTNATIDGIKARLPVIQHALPDGVFIEAFYDQSELVSKAIATISTALQQAFIFIVIVLLLFLINIRATVLVLISVPISIGLALMLMAHWGISANLMSLGGLAIAIGMIVDGSVVMMENIYQRLSSSDNRNDKATISIIKTAAQEVGRPIFFAVMIIVIVFMPLFTLEGVEAKLFQPMAISIVLAMLTSLAVALLVIPALASYSFRREIRYRQSWILLPFAWLYRRLLSIVLKLRLLLVLAAFALFIATAMLVPSLGTEFVPELEEGTLNIRVTLAPSSSLDSSLDVAQKLETILLNFPEVTYASSRIGRSEIGGDPEPVSNIEIFVGLKPVNEWISADNRKSLQAMMEEEMSAHPGLLFTMSQPIATRVDELLSGVKAQLAVKLFGPDLTQLEVYGKKIETLMRGVEGTRSVELEQTSGEAQLVIKPNRDVLARYGIPVSQVMGVVEHAIGGLVAGQVINGNERYDISVRLDERYRDNIQAIQNLILQAPSGAWLRLADIASVAIESGPPQIRRDDVQRRIVIQSNVEGRDMGGLVAELRQRIENEIDLPAGYSVVFGGQFESQQRAQARLSIVVPLSLGLIFILLYVAFNSVGQALLIMLNVPLALIGGVLALYYSGQYLSVPSSIGFITLLGVAVLNGVVMVSAINQRICAGEIMNTAVFEGAISRFRPVLMTAITSALGLIPLLLSTGVGSEVQRPLATVVVGGLASSTILTLFVIPSLYGVFSAHATKRLVKNA